jgi:hypothetical protein
MRCINSRRPVSGSSPGWVLTAWGLYFLLWTLLLIVELLVLGVVTASGGSSS